MPAQKRSCEHLEEDSSHNNDDNNVYNEEEEEDEEYEEDGDEVNGEDEEANGSGGDGEAEEEEEDSYGSSSEADKDEYVYVKLSDIRKEVQCPICLGIIRKTRTVMECLHRFCRECIDKSMRLGNNECPACRTHCASRRSLRDDPRYDSIIAALYPDIDKYEEEELAFREDEKTRNKQIQASIALTFRRQSEALGRRRTTDKAVAAFMRRCQGHYRRGRSSRNSRAAELQSDDDEDGNGNDGGRDSSSADERSAETRPKRRRWGGTRFSNPSSAVTNGDENDDSEVNRESPSASPVFIASPEVLAWGRGGVRSHTRYGSLSGNGKSGRGTRLAKLLEFVRASGENDDQLDAQLTLVPLDEEITPPLEEPYLCCQSTLSIEQLCEFIAAQTTLKAEEIEILVVKEPHLSPARSADDTIPKVDPVKDNLQILEKHETLGDLQTYRTSNAGHLVLAYKGKPSS